MKINMRINKKKRVFEAFYSNFLKKLDLIVMLLLKPEKAPTYIRGTSVPQRTTAAAG